MQEAEQGFSFKNLFFPLTAFKAIHIIVIVGLIVFGNMLFNGFVGDDFEQIIENPSIHSVFNIPAFFSQGTFYDETGQANNFFRPVLSIVFSLVYVFFRDNPFGYHLAQIMLHIANAILVFAIFNYFFKPKISIFLSLIFLIHPINTEAVVYISALNDNLFLFFGLLSIFFLIKKQENYLVNLLIPLFLLLSLLSKETGIVFLFLTPLFTFINNRRRFFVSLAQSISALLIYLFMRLAIAHIDFMTNIKIAQIQTLSLGERIISIPSIIFFYLKTLIYPLSLSSFQTWIVKAPSLNDFYLPLLVDIAFFSLLIFLALLPFKKNKDLFIVFLFFFVWFVVGLGMHLQIIPLDQTVSERWLYFPIIGLLGSLGVLLKYLNIEKNIKYQSIIFSVIVITLVFYSIRVIVRNTNWHSETSLYSHDFKSNKDSYQLATGLGKVNDYAGDLSKAEQYYIRATQLYPSHITFGNLGSFYLHNNEASKAAVAYNTSQKYYGGNVMSWVYLGIAEYNSGDKTGAIVTLKKAYGMLKNESILTVLNTMEKGDSINIYK